MRSVHTSAYQVLLDRLRKARRAAGLTQAQVADAMRRPQSFVSKSESGERRLDPIELAELARLYEKPMDFFVAELEAAAGGASVSREGRAAYSGKTPPRSSRRPKAPRRSR